MLDSTAQGKKTGKNTSGVLTGPKLPTGTMAVGGHRQFGVLDFALARGTEAGDLIGGAHYPLL